MRIASSTACRLSTGSAPGRPSVTGSMLRVRLVAEAVRARREQLRRRRQLDVHLEPDDESRHPLTRCASSRVRVRSAQAAPCARGNSSSVRRASLELGATRNITGSPSVGASTCTPTGRPSAPVPNGTLIAGIAGQVGRDRVRVAEVHRQRVVGLVADREGDRRRRRREQHVGVLVGAGEVVGDQPAHLQRLAVVGVVVAGRQGVGAEHDPPLDLVAEAGGPGGHVHRVGVGRLDAQAVAHAVVAGEVARRLRRGDQVVGGEPVGERRHLDVDDLGAGLARARRTRRRGARPRRGRRRRAGR